MDGRKRHADNRHGYFIETGGNTLGVGQKHERVRGGRHGGNRRRGKGDGRLQRAPGPAHHKLRRLPPRRVRDGRGIRGYYFLNLKVSLPSPGTITFSSSL